ncbi:MAG: nuclear transport factor 2 family protein [Solirubrobacterales bacterium]
MELDELRAISNPLIAAWNEQDPDRVVDCYTEDLIYMDPNTRGAVEGADAFRRYLTKLFGRWQMHWEVKETFPLRDADGAAGLWRASFRLPGGEQEVHADGMDLILIEGDRVKRNEVYFDRAVLAPLVTESVKEAAA